MNSRLCFSFLLAAFGAASSAPAQNQVTSSAWTPLIDTSNFVWYPVQKAIRFGQIDSSGSTYWSASSVGDYSFAGGLNAFADDGGFAFGQNAYAGGGSFAFGENAFAQGGSPSEPTPWGTTARFWPWVRARKPMRRPSR